MCFSCFRSIDALRGQSSIVRNRAEFQHESSSSVSAAGRLRAIVAIPVDHEVLAVLCSLLTPKSYTARGITGGLPVVVLSKASHSNVCSFGPGSSFNSGLEGQQYMCMCVCMCVYVFTCLCA